MPASRRSVLQLCLGCSVISSQAEALNFGSTDWPAPGDRLVSVDHPDRPLRVDAVLPGAPPLLAWPRNAATGKPRTSLFSQILVLRLPGAGAPIAYSAVCKHAGCIVSSWLADRRLLLCPCHGSQYDPAHHGAVVMGPADAPLPSLPLQEMAGELVVAGPFSARPGGITGRTD